MIDDIIKLGESINWEYVITILTILGSASAIIVSVVMAKKQRTADIVTSNRTAWIQEFRKIFKEYYTKVKIFEDKQAPEIYSDFLNELYVCESAIKLQLNCFGIYDATIIRHVEEVDRSFDAFLHKTLLLKRHRYDLMKISKDMIEYIDTYNPELLASVTSKTVKGYKMQEMVDAKEYDKLANLMISEDFMQESVVNLLKMESDYTKECCNVIRYLPEIILIYVQIYLKVEWERVKKESEKGNINDFDFDKRFAKYLAEKNNEVERFKKLLPKRIFD